MQKIVAILCSMLLASTTSFAQNAPLPGFEFGAQIGASQFLGDLGGAVGQGSSFIKDTDFGSTRPVFGLYGRYTVGANFAVRLDMNYLMVSASDEYAGKSNGMPERFSAEWFRRYRNLSFRSRILEVNVVGEVMPYHFLLPDNASLISPYGFIGVGIFNFKPQAVYENQWVDLAPLGTEGQNVHNINRERALEQKYPEPYKLTQLNIPLGVGVKWTYDDTWAISLEVNHRITFTDYIDDVSGEYADPSDIRSSSVGVNPDIAVALADRTKEFKQANGISVENFEYISAPGEQRGDPKDNDSYYTITLRFGFLVDSYAFGGGRRQGCPVW